MKPWTAIYNTYVPPRAYVHYSLFSLATLAASLLFDYVYWDRFNVREFLTYSGHHGDDSTRGILGSTT